MRTWDLAWAAGLLALSVSTAAAQDPPIGAIPMAELCAGKTPPQMAALPAEAQAALRAQIEGLCAIAQRPSEPVHDTADQSPTATHTNWGYDAVFSTDGTFIVSAGFDLKLRLWDAATGKHAGVVAAVPERPRHLALSPDGKRVAVSIDKTATRVFEIGTGRQLGEIPFAPKAGTQWWGGGPVAFDKAGRLFAAIDNTNVGIFPPDLNGTPVKLGGHNEVRAIAISDAANLVATGDIKGLLQFWSLDTGRYLGSLNGGDSIEALTISADGKLLAAAISGTAYVWDLAERRQIQKIKVHEMFSIFAIAFTKDGKGLITGRDHPQLWSVETGKLTRGFGPFLDLCHSIAITPDGRYALTTHMGSDLRLWDIDSGTFFRRFGKNVTK